MKRNRRLFLALGLVASVIAGVSGLSAAAQDLQVTHRSIESAVADGYASLDSLYRHLHAYPELSFHEEKTSALLAGRLSEIGYRVTTGVGGHGLVAILENGSGPTVMVRADMDALPVLEETKLPYASKVVVTDAQGMDVPVMHACGHDIHMTSLIGTAVVLHSMRDKWSGTLELILQPAEERGAGSKAMLEDGLYRRFSVPDYALALHVDGALDTGTIGYCRGHSMANVDSVDIKVRGIGGHGAYPHLTKDPVVVAAQIIVSLQTIVSREIGPLDSAVVTVGSIHGGTKHNVIGKEVDLQLTVRSYSDETRGRLLVAIERVAVNTARAMGTPEEILPTVTVKDEYTPSLYNDPELVDRCVNAIGDIIGKENMVESEPVMGGEDFARYGRQENHVPIFMMKIGSIGKERMAESQREGGTPLPSLHSGFYAPEREPTIKTGVKAMTAAVLELLGGRLSDE
ncbi:MAG: amidohydrolase [Candidatus Hydrogenedentes bacterium]|jgi:hippurate hydrolase|nr:amidohydrolase [Candidatus Hydrogenedentota bacterium]